MRFCAGPNAALTAAALPVSENTLLTGDSYEYSNVGLGLLGMALARRATARDYDELIRRWVGDPLGLKDTGVALSAGQRARFAQGHDEDGEPTPAWDFETMEGFAALRSTATTFSTQQGG